MSDPCHLRLACRNYDGTNAILRGVVTVPGIEVEALEQVSVQGMFAAMYRGEFDVSEMSLAELIYYTSRNKSDFIGVPVFPSRMFRHGFIVVRRDAGIETPQDLKGKRLGFLRWVQTAAVWIRGMLIDEYGVTPTNSRWCAASLHHWDDGTVETSVRLPGGADIEVLQGEGSAAERAMAALREGRLDMLGVTETQLPPLLADPALKRLFEDYRDVEAEYFRKTRIFPIMHVLAVRKSVVEQHPGVPAALFELFSQAKRQARQWSADMPSMVMAWRQHALDQERAVFGGDPCPFGLDANRDVLNTFIEYCEAQGICERNLSPEELFAPETWELTEQE
jgi:4,5-dihydroxyphthalate decarboxylase